MQSRNTNTVGAPQPPVVVNYELGQTQAWYDRHARRYGAGAVDHLNYAEQRASQAAAALGSLGISVESRTQPRPYAPGEYPLVPFFRYRSELDDWVKDSLPPDAPRLRTTPLSQANIAADEPVVVKNPNTHYGRNKFLVSEPWQAERLVAWRQRNPRRASEYVVQPFVETPGDVCSSYRVVTTVTGHILAASLLYKPEGSAVITGQATDTDEKVEADLVQPDSPYYLGSADIRSNGAAGDHEVLLDFDGSTGLQVSPQPQDAAMLAAHNIRDRTIPPTLQAYATHTARLLGPRFALYMGLDFLQARDDPDTFYFLETNARPDLRTVRDWWGLDGASDAAMEKSVIHAAGEGLLGHKPTPLSESPMLNAA